MDGSWRDRVIVGMVIYPFCLPCLLRYYTTLIGTGKLRPLNL